MNQILDTKLKNRKRKNYNFFRLQFIISIIIILILIILIFYFFFSSQKKEKLSNDILNNYNIYKLYTSSNSKKGTEKVNSINDLFGIIKIPKINLYYPIFSHLDAELLKIAPCKFYGDSLDENGNICIAGHNYINNKFFSNLHLLENRDIIILYDISGLKYIYEVFNSYEVYESDLSPIFDYNSSSKELTLVTCNNINSNRLIIKANQISQ